MKTIKSLLSIALFGVLLTGCAATAFIEKDAAVNFDRIKTFAWLEEPGDSGAIKKNSLQETSLRQAVKAELEKASWQESATQPDVILKHDIVVEKSLKESNNPLYSQGFTRRFYNPYTRRINYIYYPSRFVGYQTNEYETREGTLTITMIDANTDKVIWQGWSTDELNNRNITSKEIQSTVKNIFKKFDAGK